LLRLLQRKLMFCVTCGVVDGIQNVGKADGIDKVIVTA
jgi:hypothetical protein